MKYNFFNRDVEKIHEEICIPSFNKYYKIYKEKIGHNYESPNINENSTNYGFLFDSINSHLKLNNYEYDCRFPNTPYIGMWLNKSHINGNHQYFNETLIIKSKTLFFLDSSDKTPKVSRVVKDLFNSELHKKYIEYKIENDIKRFFLFGGIEVLEYMIDNVYNSGFNFIKNHVSDEKWEYLYDYFLRCYNGESGRMTEFPIIFHSNLITKENKLISLPLVGLTNQLIENTSEKKLEEFINESKEKGITLSDNSLKFFKNTFESGYRYHIERVKLFKFLFWNEFDNVQYHEIIPKNLYNEFIDTFRNPENKIRDELGLPKIGEGWVKETKLFYLIKERFKNYRVLQHGKPKWLGKQHLDIYLPDFNVGIEYQGEQHTTSIEIFGGEDGLKNNQERDRRKKFLCEKNELKLYEVFPDDDFFNFVDQISNIYLK